MVVRLEELLGNVHSIHIFQIVGHKIRFSSSLIIFDGDACKMIILIEVECWNNLTNHAELIVSLEHILEGVAVNCRFYHW